MVSAIDRLKHQDALVIGLFCLLAVERLMSIYESFSMRFGISFEEYKSVLSRMYEILTSGNASQIKELSITLDEMIPDTDDYDEVIADQAQCAAICMMYSLTYLGNNDISMVEYALQKLSEAIDIYGYETSDSSHIAAREEAWQNHLLDEFESNPTPSNDDIERLRKQNFEYSIPSV